MTTPSTTTSNSIEQTQSRAGALAAGVILLAMFVPGVLSRVYICDDLLNYHLPLRKFYADCLKSGDSFDWMPQLFSGFFLTGSGQAGTYHPWHWLLYRTLPLELAFNLELVSSYPFLLFGMKLLLQRLLQRSDAAWAGAITFTFSGFCTLHFLHPNAVAVVSHIPWLLLAQHVILSPGQCSRTTRAMAAVGVALLTGSQLLLGYPQYVWYSLLTEAIWCLCFVDWSRLPFRSPTVIPAHAGIQHAQQQPVIPAHAGIQHAHDPNELHPRVIGNHTHILQPLALLIAVKLLGLALGAVQLLPSMDALRESDRTQMPPEYFHQFPIQLADLLQLVHPYLTKSRVIGVHTHELGLYCGAVPLLLALIAIARSFTRPQISQSADPLREHIRNERRLFAFAVVIGILAVWLALGVPAGLYAVQLKLPLIGSFRWPSRIIVLIHFALAILAAIGFLRLSSHTSETDRRPLNWLWLIPALSIGAATSVRALGSESNAAPMSLLVVGPILFLLAVVMTGDVARGRIGVGLLLFLAGDLAAYGFTYEALNSTSPVNDVLNSIPQPPGKPSDGRIVAETHRYEGQSGFHGNELLLHGWHQADGYEGLMPQQFLIGRHMTLDSLRIAGVSQLVNRGQHAEIPGVIPSGDADWLTIPNPLPRARLTRQTRLAEVSEDSVQLVDADGPVLVDQPVDLSPVVQYALDVKPRIEPTAAITLDRPGRISVSTICAEPQLLVIAERWSSGWKATLDNQPATIVRADLDFVGVVVPAGTSIVDLHFQPDSLRHGRMISLLAASVLTLFAIASMRSGSRLAK